MTGHAEALVDRDAFRAAMAELAAPVTVVTTADEDGRWHGFTASAVASLSADPPLVLVAMGLGLSTYPVFARAPGFVVNVLAADHHPVADRFATHDVDRFAGPERFTAGPDGLPHLTDALVRVRCLVHDRQQQGDHVLLIGAVTAAEVGAGRPLVWHRRGYRVAADV